jgi:4-hydroxy-2-oxoheptanedioate aldolase
MSVFAQGNTQSSHTDKPQGIIIDCEHGHISDDAMHSSTAAIAALGVSPLVRLRMTHPDLIKRALDAGSQ